MQKYSGARERLLMTPSRVIMSVFRSATSGLELQASRRRQICVAKRRNRAAHNETAGLGPAAS